MSIRLTLILLLVASCSGCASIFGRAHPPLLILSTDRLEYFQNEFPIFEIKAINIDASPITLTSETVWYLPHVTRDGEAIEPTQFIASNQKPPEFTAARLPLVISPNESATLRVDLIIWGADKTQEGFGYWLYDTAIPGQYSVRFEYKPISNETVDFYSDSLTTNIVNFRVLPNASRATRPNLIELPLS